LNKELTLAGTHYYASKSGPFWRLWNAVVAEEPDFARESLAAALQNNRPDLATRTRRLVSYLYR
jgi:G:T/U-mismatch repair DNA glycosylase